MRKSIPTVSSLFLVVNPPTAVAVSEQESLSLSSPKQPVAHVTTVQIRFPGTNSPVSHKQQCHLQAWLRSLLYSAADGSFGSCGDWQRCWHSSKSDLHHQNIWRQKVWTPLKGGVHLLRQLHHYDRICRLRRLRIGDAEFWPWTGESHQLLVVYKAFDHQP